MTHEVENADLFESGIAYLAVCWYRAMMAKKRRRELTYIAVSPMVYSLLLRDLDDMNQSNLLAENPAYIVLERAKDFNVEVFPAAIGKRIHINTDHLRQAASSPRSAAGLRHFTVFCDSQKPML